MTIGIDKFKRSKTCGIYRITNTRTKSKKKYIGSSIRLKGRIKDHIRYLRHNRHENEYLQRSFNKYGEKAFEFEIIEQLTHEDEVYLIQREEYWVDYYNADDRKYGYNIEPPKRRRINKRKCKVPRCKRPHLANGYCNTHYLRMKRHGTLTIDHLPPKKDRGCKVRGCNGKHDSLGYCGKHSMRYRKHGRTTVCKNVIDPTRGCKVIGCKEKHNSGGLCHKHQEAYRYYKKQNRVAVFYQRFPVKTY